MTRLLSAAALAAVVVLLLPVSIPLCGILALCAGFSRHKPVVRPRRHVVQDGALFWGDIVVVPVSRTRIRFFRRTRGRCWWRMISPN